MEDYQVRILQRRATSCETAYRKALEKPNITLETLLYLRSEMEKADKEYREAHNKFQYEKTKQASK